MASQRQLEANRANARRSTGPKSQRGKARSKINAVTHGLTATEIVVPGEDPEQFDRLREGLNADFAPGSTIERKLVDVLAGLLWRQQRLPIVEAELLKKLMDRSSPFDPSRLTNEELEQIIALYEKANALPAEHTCSDLVDQRGEEGNKKEGLPTRVAMLNILARYETSLMNQIAKTINLIHTLQARRLAAEERARTVNATPSKGPLPAVQNRSPSSQSMRQKMAGSNERSHPDSMPDSLVPNGVGVTRQR